MNITLNSINTSSLVIAEVGLVATKQNYLNTNWFNKLAYK